MAGKSFHASLAYLSAPSEALWQTIDTTATYCNKLNTG
jgi:hypothetical protein